MKKPVVLPLFLVLVLGLLVTRGGPAGAQAVGGELGPDYVRAGARDLGGGTFPGSGIPATAPSAKPLFQWSRSPSHLVCVVFPGPVPAELATRVQSIPGPSVIADDVIGPGAPVGVPAGAVSIEPGLVPADATVVGELVYDVGQGDNVIVVVPRCVRPGAPPIGEPPSPAEVWEQAPLPLTRVHASPPGTSAWPGITRLASHFWAETAGDAVAAVSLHGLDVTVVAHPVAYAWVFGDGTTVVRSDPGSAESPVLATFVRRGDYDVQLYVVWHGVARVSFAGLDLGQHDLGTVTLPTRAPFHVAEIRALLRTTPGRR